MGRGPITHSSQKIRFITESKIRTSIVEVSAADKGVNFRGTNDEAILAKSGCEDRAIE